MSKFLLPIAIGFVALLPHAGKAQDASFYDCQNDRIPIAIASMPLDKALAKFTSVTRCPVSIDTDRIRGRSTRSMKTVLIKGRLTPEQALVRMLRNTPLNGRMIHGGFSVSN